MLLQISFYLAAFIHLAAAIVLPSVDQWTQNQLEGLLKIVGQDDKQFSSAFDGFISTNATDFTWNGAHISRDEYKQKFQSQAIFVQSVDVNFTNVVAEADDGGPLFSGGVGDVGLFYTVTFTESDSLRVPATEAKFQSSINVVVVNDIPPPPPSPIRGYFDGRRVIQVNQIVAKVN
ncbi:hypothetical protein VNI00_019404 [Paramarasmius palmivorus]|uniref:Uncharacterized protein n=1 Tax=Paramarasmius palmivorus TaxID=297713 RepID=A0AAW0ANW1_9AGAR